MSQFTRKLQRVSKQRNSILWGAYIDKSTYGTSMNAPWGTDTWDLFELHAGKKVSIMHYGKNPWWDEPFYGGIAENVTQRGAYPFIDMMIYDNSGYTLSDIAAGKYDAAWTAWCQDAKTWGKPFLFRWCGEMNGDWHDYGREEIAVPGSFVLAWRHIKTVADAVGATNITWVWCPNVEYGGQISLAQVYPGDAYVDWTSMDGYNWATSGSATNPDQWTSFYSVFKPTYDAILELSPNKPMIISETGCNEGGGSKADWITDAFTVQLPTNFPAIKAVTWFNWPIPENGVTQQWPIESSESSQTAFKNAIASDYYIAGNMALPSLHTAIQLKVPAP